MSYRKFYFFIFLSIAFCVGAEDLTKINQAINEVTNNSVNTDNAKFRAYTDELLAKQRELQVNVLDQQKQDLRKIAQNVTLDGDLDEEYTANLKLESEPQVLVFASLAMPRESLLRLQLETAKVKGKFLIRGFIENSPNKTFEKLAKIFGDAAWEVQIDPVAFREFNITNVPAIAVLPSQKQNGMEKAAKKHEVIYGDVPMDAALEHLAVYGGMAKELAQQLLAKHREKNG